MQEEMGHCQRCGICRSGWDIVVGVEYAGVGGTLWSVWNMQEWVGHCGRCGIGRVEEHCERCGICRSRWDIARGVEYAGGGGTMREVWNKLHGGGGTLREVWNMLEEVGHCERCGICLGRWDIVSGVDIQEEGHCDGCGIGGRRWGMLNTREKQSYEKQVGGVERTVSRNKLFYTFSCCFALSVRGFC